MSFEVDAQVYSIIRGWGTVVQVDKEGMYTVLVRFSKRGQSLYTAEGRRFNDDLIPELYHGEPKFIAPPEQSDEEIDRVTIKEEAAYLKIDELREALNTLREEIKEWRLAE